MSPRNFPGIQGWKLGSGDHPPTLSRDRNRDRGVHGTPPPAPRNLWARTMLPRTGSGDGGGPSEAATGAGSGRTCGLQRGAGGAGRGAAGQIWRGRAEAARSRWWGVGRLLPSPLPGWRPPSPPPHRVKSPFVGHSDGSGRGPPRRSCQGCCAQSRQPRADRQHPPPPQPPPAPGSPF